MFFYPFFKTYSPSLPMHSIKFSIELQKLLKFQVPEWVLLVAEWSLYSCSVVFSASQAPEHHHWNLVSQSHFSRGNCSPQQLTSWRSHILSHLKSIQNMLGQFKNKTVYWQMCYIMIRISEKNPNVVSSDAKRDKICTTWQLARLRDDKQFSALFAIASLFSLELAHCIYI